MLDYIKRFNQYIDDLRDDEYISNIDIIEIIDKANVMMTRVNIFRARIINIILDMLENRFWIDEDKNRLFLHDIDENEKFLKKLNFFNNLNENEIFIFYDRKDDNINLFARNSYEWNIIIEIYIFGHWIMIIKIWYPWNIEIFMKWNIIEIIIISE